MCATAKPTLISPRFKRQLESLDWDFPEHLPGTSKAIHWYPGTFPSELPSTLIQALSKQDDLIFDPYGGIGTTGIEALRQKRKAWLVEHNPVAFLASYVAGSLVLLKSVDTITPSILIDSVRDIIIRCSQHQGSSSRLLTDKNVSTETNKLLSKLVRPTPVQFSRKLNDEPEWDSLGRWIETQTLQDLSTIFYALKDSQLGHFEKLLGLTMLSAILRPSSSQTKSWGHIADNVLPKEFEEKCVFQLCLAWLSRTENVLIKTEVASLGEEDLKKPRFWVTHYGWQQSSRLPTAPDCYADVIITSPPYAGAIDYILAQRLSLYLLGYADEAIMNLSRGEIGARRKRTKSVSKEKWAEELVASLDQQIGYLSDASKIAFVLPHKDAGRDIGTISIEAYLDTNGWEKIFEIDRSIRQLRTRQSWTSIMKETVQIYAN